MDCPDRPVVLGGPAETVRAIAVDAVRGIVVASDDGGVWLWHLDDPAGGARLAELDRDTLIVRLDETSASVVAVTEEGHIACVPLLVEAEASPAAAP